MGGGGNNPDFWGEVIEPLLIAGGFIVAVVALAVLMVAWA